MGSPGGEKEGSVRAIASMWSDFGAMPARYGVGWRGPGLGGGGRGFGARGGEVGVRLLGGTARRLRRSGAARLRRSGESWRPARAAIRGVAFSLRLQTTAPGEGGALTGGPVSGTGWRARRASEGRKLEHPRLRFGLTLGGARGDGEGGDFAARGILVIFSTS